MIFQMFDNTGCLKKVVSRMLLEPKNPNQDWVLWGQIFPWTWLESDWSYYSLINKRPKNNFWSKPIEIAKVARGFRLLLIEQLRCRGFSSTLLWVTFLRHPVSCYVNCLPTFVLLTSSHQVVDYMIPFYPDPFGLFVNMEVNKKAKYNLQINTLYRPLHLGQLFCCPS